MSVCGVDQSPPDCHHNNTRDDTKVCLTATETIKFGPGSLVAFSLFGIADDKILIYLANWMDSVYCRCL